MQTTAFHSQIQTIDLQGPAGRLEALLNTGAADAPFAALVCHPHPLFGGTMHNKVVYNTMKVFSGFGLPVLRFNFRGAGLSEGAHDNGIGEQEDVRAAVDWLEERFGKPILFAGFSFGSNVGMRACCGDQRVAGLVALGLPVQAEGRSYAYSYLPQCMQPKLFLSGDHDQFGPVDAVERIVATAPGPKRMVWIENAEHFFAGVPGSPSSPDSPGSPGSKLTEMQAALRSWLTDTFPALAATR